MAFEMLDCFQKEEGKAKLANCSDYETNSTLYKRCLANFNDEDFDNYMMLFGQTFMICEYFNGTRPILTTENVLKVSENGKTKEIIVIRINFY